MADSNLAVQESLTGGNFVAVRRVSTPSLAYHAKDKALVPEEGARFLCCPWLVPRFVEEMWARMMSMGVRQQNDCRDNLPAEFQLAQPGQIVETQDHSATGAGYLPLKPKFYLATIRRQIRTKMR